MWTCGKSVAYAYAGPIVRKSPTRNPASYYTVYPGTLEIRVRVHTQVSTSVKQTPSRVRPRLCFLCGKDTSSCVALHRSKQSMDNSTLKPALGSSSASAFLPVEYQVFHTSALSIGCLRIMFTFVKEFRRKNSRN